MADHHRISRWCVVDGRVGIITEVPGTVKRTETVQVDDEDPTQGTFERTSMERDASTVNVHFVNEKGETTEEAFGVPASSVREARIAEMPASRRPADDANLHLGYAE